MKVYSVERIKKNGRHVVLNIFAKYSSAKTFVYDYLCKDGALICRNNKKIEIING